MRKQIKVFFLAVLAIPALLLFVSQSMAQLPYTTTKSQDCGQNYSAPRGRVGMHRMADPEGGWQTKGPIIDSFGPMPQTAYDPNYGCYPGNARTIHRYPAFHGYYYDRPYNYRHYSEYPWNKEITEPAPYPDRTRYAVPQMGSSIVMPNDPYMGTAPDPSGMPEQSTQPGPTPADEGLGDGPIPTTQMSDPLLDGLVTE